MALPLGPMALCKVIRDTFVIAMRSTFSTDPDYSYAQLSTGQTDFDNSAIEIIDTVPSETTKFPVIVVNSIIGRGTSISFSDDFLYETRDENGKVNAEVFGNQFPATIDIEVWAYDSISRDELIDREYLYLKSVKNIFADAGIEIRNVSMITHREEELGTRTCFVSGLSIDTYSEWSRIYDVTPDQLISSFNIAVQTQFSPILPTP